MCSVTPASSFSAERSVAGKRVMREMTSSSFSSFTKPISISRSCSGFFDPICLSRASSHCSRVTRPSLMSSSIRLNTASLPSRKIADDLQEFLIVVGLFHVRVHADLLHAFLERLVVRAGQHDDQNEVRELRQTQVLQHADSPASRQHEV